MTASLSRKRREKQSIRLFKNQDNSPKVIMTNN